MPNIPKLADLLAYQNDNVVQQYIYHHSAISAEQGRQIFRDLLAWMWLSVVRKQQGLPTHMFGPLLPLDEMWHTFILNTHQYIQFCHDFFGEYFHHTVEPPDYQPELDQEHLSEFLADCYDRLGEGWLMRNFGDLLPVN